MKKATVKRRWIALLLTLTLALSLAAPALACGPDLAATYSARSGRAARIGISVSDTVSCNPGETKQVNAIVTDNDNSTRLTWTSSDTTIVEVDYNADTLADSAYIRGLKPGTATVTVKDPNGSEEKKITVTVNGISLLNGDTVTVPENGTVTWLRGTDFELFGTAAEGTVSLTSDKSNVTVRSVKDAATGKDSWVFNGIRQGGAMITAQPLTTVGATTGSSVTIRVTVQENTAEPIVPAEPCSITNPLRFSSIEAQMAVQCREMIQDSNNSLLSVTDLIVDPKQGTLYLNYVDVNDTGAGVGSSLSYYVSTSPVGPYLKDIYFVPNPSFRGEQVTITFTGTSAGGRTFKGKINVSITANNGGSAAVVLTTPENVPLKLTASSFATAFQTVSGAPLHSVSFAIPSELQGTIYRDYVNESNYASKITGNDRFTQSELNELTFVPAAGYVGTVVISYAGYTAAGLRYNGELTIKVTQSVDGAITYNDGGMGQATFSEADFAEYCIRVTGAQLGWVTFTLPAASQGTLYYDYGGAANAPLAIGDVFPYQGIPNISYVTMVPADGFAGTAKIFFNGANENGATFSGTVEVHFQSAGGGMDITYTCLPGSSVKLASNDFNNLCQSLTGQRLHYVIFQSLPDHTLGALYHNRSTAGVIGNRVSQGTKYFNSAAPYIMNLSFWATENFHGDVEIPFTGCSVSGQTFNGSLVITSTPTKTFNSLITYSVSGRTAANFVASQFDNICRAATNSALSYVRFSSLPMMSQGSVYMNYQTSATPTTISTADTFYLSGEVSLSKLSFVPAPGFTGTVSIPFTGWSIAGGQFQGTVQVSVAGGVTGTNVLYTTTGSPVQFSAYDFYNEGGGQPLYLSFSSTPYASQGKLYYQYTNPTHFSSLATPGMQYGFLAEPLLANLTFVPKAGYKGTVTIPYTAATVSGVSYTGEIQIAVDPALNSKYFRDLTGHSAETVAAVDFLYSQGVVNGVSADYYAPAQNIRRGDFCLMLYRAFQFSSDGTTAAFQDVPSSSYYAQAINVLRSQGIVEGTGGNSFRPNASISRQDAALMVQRTLRAAGLNAADGTDAFLEAFDDGETVEGYARGAVTCLLQQGIMPFSGNTLSPKAALTRSDMAVLLHRAIAQ